MVAEEPYLENREEDERNRLIPGVSPQELANPQADGKLLNK